MIVVGYNGFSNGADLFGRLYHAAGVDRHLLIGHDAAAALMIDGELVAAVEEERLNRQKKTSDFPVNAVRWCLEQAGLGFGDVDLFAFPWRFSADVTERMITDLYEFPAPVERKLEQLGRLSELYTSMLGAEAIRADFARRTGHDLDPGKLVAVPHHLAHLMCGYYVSGGADTAFLISDGRAETLSSIMGEVRDGVVRVFDQAQISNTSSLALLYGKLTRYLGFVPNQDEYKVMGLAAYGSAPASNPLLERFVMLHDDGGYAISLPGEVRSYYAIFDRLFGGDPADRETFDYRVRVAAAAQQLVEVVTAHQVRAIAAATGQARLVFEGGLALNCVNNSRLARRSGFDIEVSFGASDPGVAIGAAVYATHPRLRGNRGAVSPYLGPEYDDDALLAALRGHSDRVRWTELAAGTVAGETAKLLLEPNVVGWFQGRTEYGPRALGNRSILANPGFADIKDIINVRVKRREPFRPFAPVVLEEDAARVFEMGTKRRSPYMTFVFPVRPEYRDVIPGACHVDGTARIQTVGDAQNPPLAALLRAFTGLSGVPCLLNTSFNVAGEPIVSSPHDALETFVKTEIDYLVLGRYLVRKREAGTGSADS